MYVINEDASRRAAGANRTLADGRITLEAVSAYRLVSADVEDDLGSEILTTYFSRYDIFSRC
jgi:hypothetical protein